MAYPVIRFEIDLFIFDAAPHPFDEHVVTPGTLSIHGQKNVPAEHRVGEFGCGELAALIRVDDLGQPVFRKRLLQRRDCMATLQRDRHPVCQHPTARPVHYGRQIRPAGSPLGGYEAPRHRDIARIERPDRVVRVTTGPRCPPASSRPAAARSGRSVRPATPDHHDRVVLVVAYLCRRLPRLGAKRAAELPQTQMYRLCQLLDRLPPGTPSRDMPLVATTAAGAATATGAGTGTATATATATAVTLA